MLTNGEPKAGLPGFKSQFKQLLTFEELLNLALPQSAYV